MRLLSWVVLVVASPASFPCFLMVTGGIATDVVGNTMFGVVMYALCRFVHDALARADAYVT